MSSFALTIPDWVITVVLVLMTVKLVATIIDIVLKIQIKKNQKELDEAIKEQSDVWKVSLLHDDKKG